MSQLTPNMTHAEAALHLRQAVIPTARYETGRLIDPDSPAFLSAIRGTMCDLDYVAALYSGWDGIKERQIATRKKSIRFLTDVVALAAPNPAYGRFAPHLYDAYRVGTVHLRGPKQLRNPANTPPIMSWALMVEQNEDWPLPNGTLNLTHLVPTTSLDAPPRVYLPLSIRRLFEDFVSACERFAVELETEARAARHEMLDLWNSAAVGLTQAAASELTW